MAAFKWFLVMRTEYDGEDCAGHEVLHVVAAETTDQAASLVPRDPWMPEDRYRVEELVLPSLDRKRKPFIWR